MRAALLIVMICVLSLTSHPQRTPLHPQLKIQSAIDNLKRGDESQQKQAVFALHEVGTDAIPLLIGCIDSKEPFDQIRLVNPALSNIPPEALRKTHVGILCAYSIELILGRKTLGENPRGFEFLVGPADSVYPYGLLKRGDKSIRKKDLKRVKAIYQHWWDTHKGMSLEQLQSEWSDNKRPLTGSPFKWL